jgi:putative transposase
MARHARLKAAGLPVHIVQRGHAQGACFLDPTDYQRYLDRLEDQDPKARCAVHAFVLMTNHIHLLVTPETEDGTSRLMKAVAQHHAQYVNWRHGRIGSLWGDRFFSSIVQSDRYFLAVSRYIELNPVRARIVGSPEMYSWSSFRHNALGGRSTLLTRHSVYDELGRTQIDRCAAYRSLFCEELDDDSLEAIRAAARRGLPLV